MDLSDALSCRRANLDQLLSRAKVSLGLTSGDVLFACGSLVEGLGNRQSDIDLILITSRADIAFTSLTDVFFALETCIVEVRIKQWSDVDLLLNRFERWLHGPRSPRGAFDFNEEERKFLHRLVRGQLLFGREDFRHLQNRVSVADLAWHRFEWSRHFAETLQIDLAGSREVGDAHTMLFMAQEILSHTIDALLAGYEYTNPIQKWRARHLLELPDRWEDVLPGSRTGLSAMDRYLSLNRAPETVSLKSILPYALRIVAFSRSVFAWVEYKRFQPASAGPILPMPRKGSGPGDCLPHLDLNVALRSQTGRFEIVRLNSGEAEIELSFNSSLVLCLFDGETSRLDAINYANNLLGSERGEGFVEDLIALTRHAKLTFEEGIDEDALQKTLRSAGTIR